MSEQPIHVVDAVVEGVRQEFRNLATELDNAREPVRTQAAKVSDGAGQFADELADGLAAFELSWRAALEATGETAATLAANVGGFRLDLQAVDRASS